MDGYLDHWMDDPDEAEAFVYLFQRQPSTPLAQFGCFGFSLVVLGLSQESRHIACLNIN